MTNHLAISRNYWFIKMFCLLYIQNKILLGDRRQHLFDEYIQDLTNKTLLDSRDSGELLPYVDARRRLCVRSSNIVTFFYILPEMNWQIWTEVVLKYICCFGIVSGCGFRCSVKAYSPYWIITGSIKILLRSKKM